MPNFREPTTARYIYLTPNGDIDVQMPIVGAMPDKSNKASISTDNTCKTLKVIQEFFGVSALSTNPSLDRELKNYKQRLEYDLTLIGTLGSQISANVKAIQQNKQHRLNQIIAWQKFLHEVASKPEITNHINNGAGYSPSIKVLIKDKLYSMVLRPAQIDSFRSGLAPTFDMSKAASFYQLLLTELAQINSASIKPQKDNRKDLLVAEALKSLKDLKTPITSDSFDQIKKALSNQLPAIYKFTNAEFFSSYFDSHSKKPQETTLAYFKTTLCIVDDKTTVEECAKSLISLCGAALPQQADQLFHIKNTNPDNLEKLNLTLQFFLGHLNIACVSWKKTTANFAALLENNKVLASGFIKIVTNCLAQGELVEPALLAYINQNYQAFNLDAPLTDKQQQTIIPQFQDLYTTIANSQHLDEFTILTDDNRGVCAQHQGSIVVPFRALANKLNIELDKCLLFSTPTPPGMVLENENSAIAREQLDQDIDYITLIKNALSSKPPQLEFIAQLLVSKTTVASQSKFLFTQLSLDNVTHIKSNQFWPQLRACVTSKLTGMEITAFETHFQCIDISYPLTGKMLYALEINLIKSLHPSQWINPDDYYGRGRLATLLQKNGLQATKVPEYLNYHGVNTIICTPQQKTAIEKIVEENDNQIYISPAMARAIYIAANEAAGTPDWDLVDGNRLDNKTNKGGFPAKIKRAFQLLNINFSDKDYCYYPKKSAGYLLKSSPQIQQEILQLAAARPQFLITETMIEAFEIYVKRLPPQAIRDSGLEKIPKNDLTARVTCLLNLIGYKTKNIGLNLINPREIWVEVHEEVKCLYQWIAEKRGNVTLSEYLKSGLGGRVSSSGNIAYAHLQSQKLENNIAPTQPPREQISGNGGGLNPTPVSLPAQSAGSTPIPLPKEITDRLTKLRAKIVILGEYGANLTRTVDSKKAQDKGQVIEKLVSRLNTLFTNFETDFTQKPDINIWDTFKGNFHTALDDNKAELRKYSSNLKPFLAIIASIIAALTGLGTIIMAAKLIKAKQEDKVLSINSACLFGRNRSEQIVDDVKETTKELDQTMHPSGPKG